MHWAVRRLHWGQSLVTALASSALLSGALRSLWNSVGLVLDLVSSGVVSIGGLQ